MSHSTDHAVTHAGDHGHTGHHDGEFSHPAPVSMLLIIFFVLLALTGLTVYQSTLDLGESEIIFSLAIATLKAGLVIMFFMHMLWDKLMNGVIFFSSLIFVALFLGFTLLDASATQRDIIPADTLQQSLPQAEKTVE